MKTIYTYIVLIAMGLLSPVHGYADAETLKTIEQISKNDPSLELV